MVRKIIVPYSIFLILSALMMCLFTREADLFAEDVITYRESGLVITIKRLPAGDFGNRTFEVAVENQNVAKKTLYATICLFSLSIRQSECGSAACEVYMELPPKTRVVKNWQCQDRSHSGSWSFKIVRISDF